MTDLNTFSIYKPTEFGPQLPYYPIPYLHTIVDTDTIKVYENEFGKWCMDLTEGKVYSLTIKLWNRMLHQISCINPNNYEE